MEHRQARLLAIIDERLQALGLSERKASLNAVGKPDFIRDIRRRGHSPKADKLAALARVLQVPPARLLEAVEPDPSDYDESAANLAGSELASSPLNICYIVGNVEAGAWRTATELPKDEWEPVPFEPRVDFPSDACRFGLRVRGLSMNRFYPPGTILDCIRFIGADRSPHEGDHVIVYRRGPGDLIEATVKELTRANGRWELWPRSTHPDYQEPLVLDHPPDESDENEDVQIIALVVGSYHRRT